MQKKTEMDSAQARVTKETAELEAARTQLQKESDELLAACLKEKQAREDLEATKVQWQQEKDLRERKDREDWETEKLKWRQEKDAQEKKDKEDWEAMKRKWEQEKAAWLAAQEMAAQERERIAVEVDFVPSSHLLRVVVICFSGAQQPLANTGIWLSLSLRMTKTSKPTKQA